MKIEVSFSLNGSTSKPSEIGKMKWRKECIEYSEFIKKIEEGYCVTHVFTKDDSVFSNHRKKDKNFKYTYFIAIDVDDSDIPMVEYLDKLNCTPSFAYHTYNDGLKGYRFRLVYVFDTKIYKEEYKALYNSIKECAGINNLKDDCMKSLSQCIYGNGRNAQTVDFCHIFSKDDFLFGVTEGTCDIKYMLDEGFFQTLMSNKPSDFLDIYRGKYDIVTSSLLTLSDDGSYYTFPETYYSVTRPYVWDYYTSSTGDLKPFTKAKRIRDGQKRRKKLFSYAVTKCRIKPDITLEELVYNIVWEREMFFDNTDKILTNMCIVNICKNAMSSQMEISPSEHPSFTVNKEWAYANGMTPNQAKRVIMKRMNDAGIGSWYDVSKSVKQNLEFAHDNGIKVSKTTLYDWCKANSISTKGEG